ncbi:hypothetical protein MJO29_010792 [Puccinia striiformis f. sp. tritici]|nr:hypothetical protein MJO29_010792 [Puccinia striiformis f. sp. tritici]
MSYDKIQNTNPEDLNMAGPSPSDSLGSSMADATCPSSSTCRTQTKFRSCIDLNDRQNIPEPEPRIYTRFVEPWLHYCPQDKKHQNVTILIEAGEWNLFDKNSWEKSNHRRYAIGETKRSDP